MKVTSTSQIQEIKDQDAAHLKKLTQKQRNIVTQKENEIENLGKIFEDKKNTLRQQGEINLFNQVEKNKIDVENSILTKEQKLEKIKDDLQKSTYRLEDQKNALNENYKTKFEQLNEMHAANLIDFSNENETKAREFSSKANEQIKNISQNANQAVADNLYESKAKTNEILVTNSRNIENLKSSLKDDEKNVIKDQEDIINQLSKEHQKNVLDMTKKGTIELSQRSQMNASQLKNEDTQYQDVLKQKRISFEQKYNELEKTHTEVMNRLKQKFDSQIKQAVDSYSTEKKLIDAKSSDDFYKISKFEPIVKEEFGHYIISVPISEYEKENVNLTAQNRDIIVTLNRRFSDKVEDELNAESFKTSRSEVISKKFKVDNILDSKKVTTNYSDGFLNYKIEKM